MSEREKLVEELDNACRATMTVEEFWQRAITLILSAVHDGRLKLPGEVGRFKMRHPMNELDDGDILIALSGTGKEEEK